MHTRCMLDRAENLVRGYADPKSCVARRSAWPGESRPPHPAELAKGISMDGHKGRWGAVRGAMQFATRVQRHVSGLESASYVTTGIYGTFELMLHAFGRSSTSSFLPCSLFCDALDRPQGAYLDFSRPREWETASGRYRTLFAAYAIQPQDILLRIQNQRIYIAPHVQQCLVGLDAECEERLTRWTLGVRSASEAGNALPSFSTAMAATPERTDRTLENDPLHTGPTEQGGAARRCSREASCRGKQGCISLRLLRAGTKGAYWRFGGGLFMGTYSVSPRRASTCPLHARPCGTPREWACRPTTMRCVSLGMAGKKSASSSG